MIQIHGRCPFFCNTPSCLEPSPFASCHHMLNAPAGQQRLPPGAVLPSARAGRGGCRPDVLTRRPRKGVYRWALSNPFPALKYMPARAVFLSCRYQASVKKLMILTVLGGPEQAAP
jgi:hypothetical protein